MDLRAISIFEDLSDAALAAIEARCTIRSFEKRAEILGENDGASDVFFILAGTVRVTSFTDAGREVIFSDISTGGIFGEFSAIDHLPRSASVVALTDCRLARITAPAFFEVLHQHNTVSVHLVGLLVGKIRSMSERVFEVSALAVRERVRRELLRLALAGGSNSAGAIAIDPAPTHYEIAARIGSHREAVTREFNRLEAEGVVKVSRRSIHILDLRRLRGAEE